MKMCHRCGQEKPEVEFFKRKASKDGLQAICKECERERAKNWRKSNQKKVNASQRAYRERNKERSNEYLREWRRDNREYCQEEKDIKVSRYLDKWAEILEERYGLPMCEGCGRALRWPRHTKQGQLDDTVNFDHRKGRGTQIEKPNSWLRAHSPFKPENIEAFMQEEFGMLCTRCNSLLPTDLDERDRMLEYMTD